jgi:branched-chain amino acid transport system permease protein
MVLQGIVNGLLFGAVYGTIGIGFSLVWGVMNIINVSHGSFIMIGSYLSIAMFNAYGLDPFLSIPLVMLVLFIIGYVIQRFLLNLVVRGSIFITLTFTFGLQILIANICLLIWGSEFRSVKLSYSGSSVEFLGIILPTVRLMIFFAALLLTLIYFLFMRRTKIGIAINATAQNFEGAKTVGIDVRNIYAITMGVSAALAGASGALISPIMSMNPFIGGPLVAKAFIISVLGGLGSTIGALVGGIVLGIVETVGTVFVSSSYQQLIGFVVFILVLVFKPRGLLGKRFYE